MFAAFKGRSGPGWVLAVLAVCCLPSTAYCDEMQYLPDDVRVLASIDVTAGAKTKTFQQYMQWMKKMMGLKGPQEQDETVSKFISKFGRMTVGVRMTENMPNAEEIAIMTAVKPITADEVKGLKKTPAFYKNFAYKEIKHGAVTIYQETYQFQFDKDVTREGEAFYVADGKYVVTSRHVAALKKIIDRNKAAALSPAMQGGLKESGFGNIVTIIVDIQNMPAKEKEDLRRGLMSLSTHADIKDNLAKVQTLTFKMNEPAKLKLSATVTCEDAASLAAVKTAAENTLADLKAKMKEDPKLPLPVDLQKILANVRAALDTIKLSSAGVKATATLDVEPELAMSVMTGWFTLAVGEKKAKAIDAPPSKAPSK